MLNREICKGCGYYHELTGGPFVLPIWGCASFLLALIEDLSAKDGSRKKVKESGSTHFPLNRGSEIPDGCIFALEHTMAGQDITA